MPDLLHAEPVLPVRRVGETVSYWHAVLGFPERWTRGDQGGVSWGGVSVQFREAPSCPPQRLQLRVHGIEALYAIHQDKRVPIAETLEDKPWGVAQYAVRELNGHELHFAAPLSDRRPRGPFPEGVRVVPRVPSPSEYRALLLSVGAAPPEQEERLLLALAAISHGIVAEEPQTGSVIGCALVLTDQASFYYVKDVMVHPAWQGRGVGTALMQAITDWIEGAAPPGAVAALIADDHLASFYRSFGFSSASALIKPIGDTTGR